MIKPKFRLKSLVAASILMAPVASFADSSASFSVRQLAAGKYVVSGTGMNTVAGFQFSVKYDAKILSNPQIERGGVLAQAMSANNPNGAGIINFGALQGNNFPASGDIATITFTGSGTGASVWVTAQRCFDSSGTAILCVAQAPSDTPNPTPNGGDTPPSDLSPTGIGPSTTVSGGAAIAGNGTVIGGTVTMPTADDTAGKAKEQVAPSAQQTEQQVASNPQSTPRDGSAAPESRSSQETASDKGAAETTPLSVPSVLERFRLFQGERTPKNLSALFNRKDVANFVQDPPIFIADGKGTVKVIVSKIGGDRSPNFAFRSVHYVSLSKVGDGEWQIEVRPEKGATQASISMLVNGVPQELPLTVAPKARVDLVKPGTVTDTDLAHFLKERGTASNAKYDLNKDGKRDYLDDYIFIANYLVEREKQAAKEKVPAKPTAGK